MSHQKLETYTLYCVIANDDEAPSTSSEIVEQIEVIKEVHTFTRSIEAE